jgi:serine/threonine-protein kinase
MLKDRYRLERLLGRGGMASVWLGHDETLDRPVAVKVLSDTIAADAEFVARFRREARVAAGLSHPNLVSVYDYAEGDERPHLVMEFVPGEDLGSRLARDAAVDCERVARELLGAVAHIHGAGILHRDIKPQNLLIAPDGGLKLIDFGIALPRDATALTRTGLILGTERYAAPEVMQGKPATERSDLYSCGVVLRSCPGEPTGALRAIADWLAEIEPSGRPVSAGQALTQLELRSGSRQPSRAPASSSRRRPPRGAAVAVLAVAIAVPLAATVAIDGGGEEASPSRASGDGRPATSDASRPGGSAPAAVPQPRGQDSGLGAALNEEGFALIQAGRHEEAVPVLEEAVRAFPPGTEDLSYAYALFNLGNALRLSGRADDAVPVLERRLEIPNQAGVVRRELEAARREAGLR